jgi:hypothetical protein
LEEIKEIKPEELKEKKISDWGLVILVAVIALILAVIIGFNLFKKETPKTIDELHSLNLEGKLKEEEGYVYDGYSFVFANGLWYTQVQNIAGTSLFDIPLHYGPKSVEDIPTEGGLNITLFDSEKGVYITFDPLGQNLNYVALAVGEFDQNIIKAFNKMPVAACDKNETKACEARPIITCDNTNKPVLYLQQEPETKVIFENNCMIVQGQGPEIVRAVDRLLLKLYGIMP